MFYTCIDRYKNDLLVRGYMGREKFAEKIRFKPSLFIRSPKPSGWTTMEGENVDKIDFSSMSEAKKFIDEHGDVINFDIYGTTNYIHQFIGRKFYGKTKFDRDVVNVTTLDIEVMSDQGFPEPAEAKWPINAITVKNNQDNVFFTWGLDKYDSSKSVLKDKKVVYVECESEEQLLQLFMRHWMANYPDVITGWNSKEFDLPYIINRITRLFDSKMAERISPWGIIQGNSREQYGKMVVSYEIYGIEQLDYLDLFKKFTGATLGTQESYKLDHIAYVVLGDRKLDYSEHGSLFNLAKEDHQKFIDYNIKDVDIVDRLEDKLSLITLAFFMTYLAGCRLRDVFGTVGIWDAFLTNKLLKKKQVVPNRAKGGMKGQIAGGFVKDPAIGRYKWVVSFDLNSLYPHLMMQYNISPETIIDGEYPAMSPGRMLQMFGTDDRVKSDHIVTARGNLFRRDRRGIIPEIIDDLYGQRSEIKKTMLDTEQIEANTGKTAATQRTISVANTQQMAIKIMMNALYGAMSNEWFRFYDIRMAESITLSGQTVIRWAEKAVNEYLNNTLQTKDQDYVIAIDTDSVYINFEPLIDAMDLHNAPVQKVVKFLDKFCHKEIEPILEDAFVQLADKMNANQRMVMKREIIADTGIWTGKKRYILNVWNKEGVQYSEPKEKIVGIEAVRASTPGVCKDMIKDTIKVILRGTQNEVHDTIGRYRSAFEGYSVEDIAFPRSVNKIEDYMVRPNGYRKGTPIQVRASILYNGCLQEHSLGSKFEKIYSGDRIKFIYLKTPNPLNEDVIAFKEFLPKEFDLNKHVDYEKQFATAYISPIETILNAVGWTVEPVSTLEDLFI